MRGQLLGVDGATGEGQVAGDDGRRYRFQPADWAGRGEPAIGQWVDFRPDDDRAASLFPLPGPAAPVALRMPSRSARRTGGGGGGGGRDKLIAALLAFFLGALGVHRFYLGRIGSGVAMLLLSITMVGLIVTVPWALVDTLRYLVMTNRDFEDRYAG